MPANDATHSSNAESRSPCGAILRPIAEPKRPATAIEKVVVDTLSQQRALTFETAVASVAESLYRDELRAGGWMIDLGLFGNRWFLDDARRLLWAGDGELWQID